LLDRFIHVAITSAESSDNDFENLSGGKTLLSATKATILLQLIPHQPAYEVQELGKLRLDRVPLVVVATSVAFADAEHRENKLLASSLLQLLRFSPTSPSVFVVFMCPYDFLMRFVLKICMYGESGSHGVLFECGLWDAHWG
jgi:hypothetical protein